MHRGQEINEREDEAAGKSLSPRWVCYQIRAIYFPNQNKPTGLHARKGGNRLQTCPEDLKALGVGVGGCYHITMQGLEYAW